MTTSKPYDNVYMYVEGTPGTGSLTLSTAVPGFRSFDDAGVQNGETVSYSIRDENNAWEIGQGIYTTATKVLTRSVQASSNANGAINATDAAIVFITFRSTDLTTGRIPIGGTEGQVLTKQSATDYDAEWALGTPGPSGPPALPGGANTNVLFNDSDVINAHSGFTYDKVLQSATIANAIVVAGLEINATFTAPYANSASYIGSLIAANVVSNAQLIANLGSYQTSAGLAANVGTLQSNNALYIGGLPAANVVSNAQLTANLANYLQNTYTGILSGNVEFSGTNTYFDTGWFIGGATILANTTGFYANAVNASTLSVASKVSVNSTVVNVGNLGLIANGTKGSAGFTLKSNGSATYWEAVTAVAAPGGSNTYVQYNDESLIGGSAAFTFNDATNNVLIANTLTIGTATINSTQYSQTSNNALYIGGLIAVNVVSNAQLTGNLALYVTHDEFNSCVAITDANNASYLGGVSALYYVQNTDSRVLSGNLEFSAANVYFDTGFYVAAATNKANASGFYHSGTINAASHSIGTTLIANTLGVYHTGTMNAASYTVGTSYTVNSTGVYHTTINATSINAASHTVGTSFVANSTGMFHTAQCNSANLTVGTAFIANTLGAYTTGVLNAASHTVGATVVANATGVYTTGTMNSASYTVGSAFTVNSTVANISTLGVYANGSLGSNGMALYSNGTSTYWANETRTKSMDVYKPTNVDNWCFFWTNCALTIAEIKTVISGGTSLTTTFYTGADRSGGSNTAIVSGMVTSNITTGNSVTSLACTSIAANAWVWFNIIANSGTVNEFHVTMRFT